MELDITWKRVIKIWLVWILITIVLLIGISILAFLFGLLIGYLNGIGMINITEENFNLSVQIFSYIGVALISLISMKILFKKKFAEFHLSIVKNNTNS